MHRRAFRSILAKSVRENQGCQADSGTVSCLRKFDISLKKGESRGCT
jgi:hypothetical protein